MLRSFRVENHKSIKGEAELLLMPVYDKTRPVVPVTAIFGANAAGKSNVLDALRWMRDAVLNSFRLWEPERGVPRTPFKLDPAVRTAPSLFAVELLLDEVRYTYGFTVDDDRVTEEWLYTYPHNRRRTVFVRSQEGWEFGSTVPRAKLEQVVDLTPRNALFLTTAARTEVAEVAPAFRWFQQSLAFTDPSSSWREELMQQLEGPDRDALIELVRAADLGIRDVTVDSDEDPEQIRQEIIDTTAKIRPQHGHEDSQIKEALATVKLALTVIARAASGEAAMPPLRAAQLSRERELRFLHGESRVALTEKEQSYGTLAWLRVLTQTMTALRAGSVLCVDEIDSSLHPRLTARLIELFRHSETNPRGAQLIFTTHDATLLGTSFGEDILERDEVWFVEKGGDGATKLYPLSDFRPRKEDNRERRYLGGSYGAVPDVSEYEFRMAAARASKAA